MKLTKRHITRAFWFTLALIFLFESWLWDNVKEWLRALGRALGVERFEPWLRQLVAWLSPPMTLALFAVPAILIFPLKLIALAILATGHIFLGLVAIFLAKTLALGVTAFLFDICREKLLEMTWFTRVYSTVLDIRAWAADLVHPYIERLRGPIALIKAQVATYMRGDNGFLRKLSRLREIARHKTSA
ncbi:MAG: hypothetical protein N2444_02245 [Methylocystis sp.]|nr:hypothetical protein [Methylocystis sp.]